MGLLDGSKVSLDHLIRGCVERSYCVLLCICAHAHTHTQNTHNTHATHTHAHTLAHILYYETYHTDNFKWLSQMVNGMTALASKHAVMASSNANSAVIPSAMPLSNLPLGQPI